MPARSELLVHALLHELARKLKILDHEISYLDVDARSTRALLDACRYEVLCVRQHQLRHVRFLWKKLMVYGGGYVDDGGALLPLREVLYVERR